MKTQLVERRVEMNGLGVSVPSEILPENKAHILDVLRSSLYSNKPLAVLREYVTNAIDAHVEAGIPDRPVEVTMPGHMDPTLRIRDYGTGLSRPDIEYHYQSYGASRKRDDDNQVGEKGLGCKVGLAYGEAFYVTSWHDGMRRTYLRHKYENGEDGCMLVDEAPCGAETGIEIAVPVRAEDFKLFAASAKTLFKWFEPTPIVKGDAHAILGAVQAHKDRKILFQGDGWEIPVDRRDAPIVVMGGIAYPLSSEPLGLDAEQRYSYREKYARTPNDKRSVLFYQTGIVLKVPNGSVKTAANRETLEYTKRTTRFLVEALDRVIEEMATNLRKDLAAAKSLWQTRCLFNNAAKQTWAKSILPLNELLPGVCEYVAAPQWMEAGVKLVQYTGKDHHSGVYKIQRTVVDRLTPTHSTQLVLRDVPLNQSPSRIAALLQEIDKQKDSSLVLVSPVGLTSEETLEKFLKLPDFKGAPVRRLSEIAPSPKYKNPGGSTVNRDRANAKVFRFIPEYCHDEPARAWSPTHLKIEGGLGFFIPIEAFMPTYPTPQGCRTNSELATTLNLLKKAGSAPPALYGIRARWVNAKKVTGWMLFHDYLKEEAKRLLDGVDLPDYYQRKHRNALYSKLYCLCEIADDLPSGLLKSFVTEIQKDDLTDKATTGRVDAILSLAATVNLEYALDPGSSSIQKEWELVLGRYPLLKEMIERNPGLYYLAGEAHTPFIAYLTAIEKSHRVRG